MTVGEFVSHMLGRDAGNSGVYQREEMHSLNVFSVLRDDGSVKHSLQLERSPILDIQLRVSRVAAKVDTIIQLLLGNMGRGYVHSRMAIGLRP